MVLGVEKRLARRRAILRSARELVGDVGYDRTTMRALADRSRVTVPTLYNIFGSRDDLLYEAVVEAYEEMLAAAGPTAGVRGLDRLLSTLGATAETMMQEPKYAKTLLESFRSKPAAAVIRKVIRTENQHVISESLLEMTEDGLLADWVDRGVLASAFSRYTSGVHDSWASGMIPNEALDAATRFGICLLLVGLVSGEAAGRCREEIIDAQRLLAEIGTDPKALAGAASGTLSA
ncbi:MAG TPA: TetR/AcrR family transcriptional regulator [Dehalococcoidia bacterium]|nr:TetR/AcrR family transcriptional regulator [Dehalococcoidia bacterium]